MQIIMINKCYAFFVGILFYSLLPDNLSAQANKSISYISLAGEQVKLQELCNGHEFNFLVFFDASSSINASRSYLQLKELEIWKGDYDYQIIVVAVGETKAKAKAAVQEYRKSSRPPVDWDNYKIVIDELIYQGDECAGLKSSDEIPCIFPTLHVLDRQGNTIYRTLRKHGNMFYFAQGKVLVEGKFLEALIHDHQVKQKVAVSPPERVAKEKYGAVEKLAETNGVIKDLVYSDLDGDGDKDFLAAVDKSDNDVSVVWFRNEGGFQFSGEIPLTTIIDDCTSLNTVDLDADGNLDIVAFSDGYSFKGGSFLLINEGKGRFSSPYRLTTKDIVYGRVADLDGDQDQDLVGISDKDQLMVWRQNESEERFVNPEVLNNSYDEVERMYLYVNDLEGDGDMDIIYQSEANAIAWKENLGNGHFSEEQQLGDFFYEMISPPGKPSHIPGLGVKTKRGAYVYHFELVDMDNDNDLDLLVSLNDRLSWLEQLESGRFSDEKVLKKERSSEDMVSAGDIDGDGHQDIIITFPFSSRIFSPVQVRFNSGSGDFSASQEVIVNKDGKWFSSRLLRRLDMDGDGDLDLLVTGVLHDFRSRLTTGGQIGWIENKAE